MSYEDGKVDQNVEIMKNIHITQYLNKAFYKLINFQIKQS